MPESITHSASSLAQPDYVGLVSFLVKPFLEVPESLKVDCEISHSKSKVWVRIAFDGADKGRVFGRGGRNIQAIRTVLEGLAKATGYTAHLDIYGGFPNSRDGDDPDRPPERERSPVRRNGPRGDSRPRTRH